MALQNLLDYQFSFCSGDAAPFAPRATIRSLNITEKDTLLVSSPRKVKTEIKKQQMPVVHEVIEILDSDEEEQQPKPKPPRQRTQRTRDLHMIVWGIDLNTADDPIPVDDIKQEEIEIIQNITGVENTQLVQQTLEEHEHDFNETVQTLLRVHIE